jgi:hypothetical protein
MYVYSNPDSYIHPHFCKKINLELYITKFSLAFALDTAIFLMQVYPTPHSHILPLIFFRKNPT